MSFQHDRRGFIFSLDATLAVLVMIIVVAGVARVGGPELIYGQHGYLRLERYANDALEVLQLTGTMDTVVNYVKHGYLENAEKLAETELRKILPRDVQFRLVIGDVNNPRLDNVYPSAGKHVEWKTAFQNAGEVATAVRASTLSPRNRLKVLAWVDDNDENFMALLQSCTNLDIDNTSNETQFWTWLVPNPRSHDVVFIPDAEKEFNNADKWELVQFAYYGGRVVVGGKTLWYNYKNYDWDRYIWDLLGVQFTLAEWGTWDSGVRPPENSGFENMHIIDGDNFVTLPYENRDIVKYNENYKMYTYTPTSDGYVVARWETPTGNIPGIIVRRAGHTAPNGWVYPQPAVLFNMRFAQSAMDLDNPMGTADWITLAKRAIGYEEVLELITLYVWRGEAVS